MSTLSASLDLPPVAASVPAARRLVRQLLGAWGARQDHDDAALLVTELVANVVDHVGGTACLTVEATLSDDWLRLAVVDCSPVRPVVQQFSGNRPRGRGMLMVEVLADRWGCEEHRDGKRVWFELRPPLL
ncbi:ATP-binding protein [Blastococcus sp. KM273129]|uniref:ATP-binding protein n=1 Tax=Blastococcus sp. KM273129 TaxID=2570315 RepID=UPI001F1E8D17|nr:ATP-binding protein [Blastococcus sp. KM273129]MCF6736341.1 ATP-binding protein [Blastococcus sp. KM273129]